MRIELFGKGSGCTTASEVGPAATEGQEQERVAEGTDE